MVELDITDGEEDNYQISVGFLWRPVSTDSTPVPPGTIHTEPSSSITGTSTGKFNNVHHQSLLQVRCRRVLPPPTQRITTRKFQPELLALAYFLCDFHPC
jgi:hypothetical protein